MSDEKTLDSDSIGAQFERQRRRSELAIDLDCYRSEGPLHSIRFIANPRSPHVARWLQVLAHTQARVTIETANPVPAFTNEFVETRPLLPGFKRLPMFFRYLMSGLRLRFFGGRRNEEIIHAHSASGNGFVAWLSGRPFVVGCYGTEIFGAKERGPIYSWLLKKILHGAERVSALSPETTRVVIEEMGVPSDRVVCFHLGYDDTTFRPLSFDARQKLRRERQLPDTEPIWVINRRTHPHYRTLEVVEGFLEYARMKTAGRLIVLCGDSDPAYTQSVCERIRKDSFGDRITVVKPLLSPAELATWLQLSDYSISVPRTDGFSISTLESLGCATVPILADLESYRALRPCRAVRWISRFTSGDFASVFVETADAGSHRLEQDRKECSRFVESGFSTEGAIRDIANFYLGRKPAAESGQKRAA